MAAALMTSLDFVYELLWLTVFGAQTSFVRYYCILDLQCDMALCCSCNGKNAVCKHCVCARTRRPYTCCLPLGTGKCVNSLENRQERLFSTESSTDVGTSAVHVNLDATDSMMMCRAVIPPHWFRWMYLMILPVHLVLCLAPPIRLLTISWPSVWCHYD